MNEDLCPASMQKKKEQLPIMKKAREEGKIAFFRHTRLVIKERTGQRSSSPTPATRSSFWDGGPSGSAERTGQQSSSPAHGRGGDPNRSAAGNVGERVTETSGGSPLSAAGVDTAGRKASWADSASLEVADKDGVGAVAPMPPDGTEGLSAGTSDDTGSLGNIKGHKKITLRQRKLN